MKGNLHIDGHIKPFDMPLLDEHNADQYIEFCRTVTNDLLHDERGVGWILCDEKAVREERGVYNVNTDVYKMLR